MRRWASEALVAGFLSVSACGGAHQAIAPQGIDFFARATWFDLGRTCSADAPTARAPMSTADSVTRWGPLPAGADMNVRSAWLARHLPGGYGGSPFQTQGRWFFYMTRPSARDSLIAAMEFSPNADVPVNLLKSATVLQGRWTFAELYDWWLYLLPELGHGHGIWAWDIQEATNRIEISVDRDQPAKVGVIAQWLRDHAVPCHLIAYRLEGVASPM